jgi:hypothetical protein
MKRFLIAAVFAMSVVPSLRAQDITVRRADGSERRVTAAEIGTLPQVAVNAMDHGVTTRFEGVDLRALLQLADVGPTDSLRGSALRRVLVLIGADGYAATITLADLDPSIGGRRVLVVSRANGQVLAAGQGPWRTVVVDDRRAARWVRQLARIELVEVR